jgi:hypothetical protein
MRYAIQEQINEQWYTHETRQHRSHANQVFWQMFNQIVRMHDPGGSAWRLIDTLTNNVISRVNC